MFPSLQREHSPHHPARCLDIYGVHRIIAATSLTRRQGRVCACFDSLSVVAPRLYDVGGDVGFHLEMRRKLKQSKAVPRPTQGPTRCLECQCMQLRSLNHARSPRVSQCLSVTSGSSGSSPRRTSRMHRLGIAQRRRANTRAPKTLLGISTGSTPLFTPLHGKHIVPHSGRGPGW